MSRLKKTIEKRHYRTSECKNRKPFGIFAKRPRSDTEASLLCEGGPGIPSFGCGGQYAVADTMEQMM